MGANIRYKDSVFSALFSDPPVLRELYSALTGISLPPDVPVTINTLSDVGLRGAASSLLRWPNGCCHLALAHKTQ
ncbi:MAG: hypothetical protein LBU00_08195, partial [Treponema sp.]|nr:hypothetical protein [Treponema sp.]